MSTELINQLNALSETRKPLWVNGWAFSKALLLKDKTLDWSDVAVVVNHFKKMQSLVQSDVISFPLDRFFEDHLSNNPDILKTMAEKRRLGFALKTWLANRKVRQQLAELIQGITESFPAVPIVLTMPSPRIWIGQAHAICKGLENVTVTWDDAESAAMYVADFLRAFSTLSIAGVLLTENRESAPQTEQDLTRYQSVVNVAHNYLWSVGIIDMAPGVANAEIDFVISSQASSSGNIGGDISAQLWDDSAALDQSHLLSSCYNSFFNYTDIPEQAKPESVQQILTACRLQAEATPA